MDFPCISIASMHAAKTVHDSPGINNWKGSIAHMQRAVLCRKHCLVVLPISHQHPYHMFERTNSQ